MKKQTYSAARFSEMVRAGLIEAERAASKSAGGGMNFDVVVQWWPSREAMARTVRMQQKRAGRSDDWRPVVKLSDGEGY